MAGIINYYHGEGGHAVERKWIASDEDLTYVIRLVDNPHRKWIHAYGSDIGIDPAIAVGDRVAYVRLDATCGLWVRNSDRFYPELKDALARERYLRDICRKYYDFVEDAPAEKNLSIGQELRRFRRLSWLKLVKLRTGIPMQVLARGEEFPLANERTSDATFFLSYSSVNILMARQLFEDIRSGTETDVWFDRAQSGELPTHNQHIAEWLCHAISKSHGFVLLLTRASANSHWVRREITWAREKAEKDKNFRLILLKLEDVPIPSNALDLRHVIDCQGLWWSNGINEELFAALYERPGRRAWLEEHEKRGLEAGEDKEVRRYDDFQSDAGTARNLRSWFEGKDFHWKLTYEKGGKLHRISRSGGNCVVDLGIRAGDRIGFFICYRRRSTHFLHGVPLWMRSDDLNITSDEVLEAYFKKATSMTRSAG